MTVIRLKVGDRCSRNRNFPNKDVIKKGYDDLIKYIKDICYGIRFSVYFLSFE